VADIMRSTRSAYHRAVWNIKRNQHDIINDIISIYQDLYTCVSYNRSNMYVSDYGHLIVIPLLALFIMLIVLLAGKIQRRPLNA